MENHSSQQAVATKSHKSKFWVIAKIYFYIIGVNLALLVTYNIFSRIIPLKETLIVSICLFLISAVASIFAIKWGVESVFQKSIIYSREIWKISLFIAIVPIIVGILLSAWIILINLERISAVAWYLLPTLLGEFVILFISGIFYGIVSYFWFKKLSK